MDSHRFWYKGYEIIVTREPVKAPEDLDTWNAASAEILRLAEEAEQRQEGHIALLEERDALTLAVQEGQEIIGEASRALAVLAGESLIPCGDQSGPCPGHLGPKTLEAYRAALAAWHALQEGNRAAVERVREVELLLDTVRERRQSVEHQIVMGDDLRQELWMILEPYRNTVAEPYEDTLRRIVQERQELANTRSLYRAALKLLEREQRDGETLEETVERIIRERNQAEARLHRRREAVERENRAMCLELAEKAAKLLALLDSEEPPKEMLLTVEPGSAFKSVREVWRWLREQVVGHQNRTPASSSADGPE